VTVLPLFLALAVVQTADTATYADSATAALLSQARERHEYQDRLVRDYSALVRTRIDVGFGRSRFARIPPIMAHETLARVAWGLPNDLKVDVIGQRGRAVFDNAEMEAAFDRPWFIPRSLGDSIRMVDDELPATAALHPLARGAERYYRYALVDSVRMVLPGRTVPAVAIRIEPKVLGSSLVAGDLWMDEGTAEVVRFMFVFVGEYLWGTPEESTPKDSVEARRENVWAQRIVKLEADLEYGLYEGRYWMPYRQMLQLSINLPWFLNVAIPVRFLTTFSDYDVNRSVAPLFVARPVTPDSTGERDRDATRCPAGLDECNRAETGYFRVGSAERGGRWEVHYPPKDTLAAYEWPDELSLNLQPEDEDRIKETVGHLGQIQEELPAGWVGRMRWGFAFESFSDIYRFNRVQGSSFGLGYQFRPGPAFTSVVGTARFGIADKRPTGSLSWRRDAPDGRLDITAFRTVREAEPWTGGLGFGNSMNAVFTTHDNADYHLALGGGVTYRSNGRGLLRDAAFTLAFERQRSMVAEASSSLNDLFGGDGLFQDNPAITEGDYVRAVVSRRSYLGRIEFAQGAELLKDVADQDVAGRVWGHIEAPFRILERGGVLNVIGARSLGDDVSQMLLRSGGPQTVRGYRYGERVGRTLWAAQLDVSVWGSSGAAIVAFADVGDALDRVTPLETDGPLVSVGAGVSFLNGLMRLNLAKPMNPDDDVRFDLLFAAPR
jgi:hypothetical protein